MGWGDLGDGAVEEHAQGDVLARGQREGREVRPHGEVGPAVAADGEPELEASAARTVAEDRLVRVCVCARACVCARVCACVCACVRVSVLLFFFYITPTDFAQTSRKSVHSISIVM